MKKDLIFSPAMLIVGVLLFMLRTTGIIAHIAISVVGVAVLIVYSVLTKKSWKNPALEVIMRAFYGIALISGVVIMNVYGIAAISIIHKISAALFMVLMLGLFIYKVATNKKA